MLVIFKSLFFQSLHRQHVKTFRSPIKHNYISDDVVWCVEHCHEEPWPLEGIISLQSRHRGHSAALGNRGRDEQKLMIFCDYPYVWQTVIAFLKHRRTSYTRHHWCNWCDDILIIIIYVLKCIYYYDNVLALQFTNKNYCHPFTHITTVSLLNCVNYLATIDWRRKMVQICLFFEENSYRHTRN